MQTISNSGKADMRTSVIRMRKAPVYLKKMEEATSTADVRVLDVVNVTVVLAVEAGNELLTATSPVKDDEVRFGVGTFWPLHHIPELLDELEGISSGVDDAVEFTGLGADVFAAVELPTEICCVGSLDVTGKSIELPDWRGTGVV